VNDSERDVALHSAALVVVENMVPSFLYPLSLTIADYRGLSLTIAAKRSAAVVEIGLYSAVKWYNARSQLFALDFGVRQGSVLSPFLFAIYMDDIAKSLILLCQAFCGQSVAKILMQNMTSLTTFCVTSSRPNRS